MLKCGVTDFSDYCFEDSTLLLGSSLYIRYWLNMLINSIRSLAMFGRIPCCVNGGAGLSFSIGPMLDDLGIMPFKFCFFRCLLF